jgi:hypothetical protein
MTVDFEKRVGQYVALRDKIKTITERHKEELEPFKELLDKLNTALVGHLETVGADSVATPAGTAYRSAKKSATIVDMTSFWAYVVTQGDFDMVDKKANVSAVEDYIKANNSPPPGVNFSVMHVAGVRRK